MVGVITITINLLEFKLLENAITDNFIRTLSVTNKCFTILIIGSLYYEKQKSRILTQQEKVKNEMAAKVYRNFIAVGILNYFFYCHSQRNVIQIQKDFSRFSRLNCSRTEKLQQ